MANQITSEEIVMKHQKRRDKQMRYHRTFDDSGKGTLRWSLVGLGGVLLFIYAFSVMAG